jgi:hypothetical protein
MWLKRFFFIVSLSFNGEAVEDLQTTLNSAVAKHVSGAD